MLADSFTLTQYQIAGHGQRNFKILQEALKAHEGYELADVYGTGESINAFEQKMAAFLGKEAAIFFPSGTMAQQIAVRIWCDQTTSKKVAYHPMCHLEIHEQKGLKELHGIEGVLLGEATRLFNLDDLKQMEEVGAVVYELPQREIGGQLSSFEALEEMTSYCHDKKLPCHLDGARLFECLPFYEKEASEISALFDSVYVSFYKGIGGIAGAILAGTSEFIQTAKIWKRRHGGDLISLYPYVVAADYYFEQRKNNMAGYVQSAKELAALFNLVPSIKVIPEVPVTNMFHVHWYDTKDTIEGVLDEICRKYSVGLSSYVREIDANHGYFEVSIGDLYEKIPKDTLRQVFEFLGSR